MPRVMARAAAVEATLAVRAARERVTLKFVTKLKEKDQQIGQLQALLHTEAQTVSL